MVAPTTIKREKAPAKVPSRVSEVIKAEDMEDAFHQSSPSVGNTQSPNTSKGWTSEPASPSTIAMLISMAIVLGQAGWFLVKALHDWAGGPPMTERDRARLSISTADRHWKYWLLLL